MAEAGLVLSPAAEAWPGPDMVGGVGDTQDEFGEQAPDLRYRRSEHARLADTDSPFTATDLAVPSQA